MSLFQAVKISNIRRETPQTVSIAFDVDISKYSFISGQYINVEVTLDGKKHRRAYSICSAPYENELRIAVKKIPGGTVSVFLNDNVEQGNELFISKPEGNFIFQPHASNTNHYLLFGAGSGITPLMSILKTALHEEPNSKVTLFYGNRNFESIIFKKELDTLVDKYDRFNVVHVLTDGSLQVPLLSGRINFERAMQLISDYAGDALPKEIYTCGPVQMMKAVKSAADVLGFAEEKVHMEYFTAPVDSTAKKEATEEVNTFDGVSHVEVILDDDSYTFEVPAKGKTILDYCIEEDLDPPYSCRGGVCVSCMAKVVEGKVVMDSNNALTDKELSEGYILTCQAHPASSKVKITFDD